VLGDAHRVEDVRGLRVREEVGGRLDILGRDARDLRDVLERVLGLHHDLLELVEVLGPLLDELLVLQVVLDDVLHEGVEERDVRARVEGQVDVGELRRRRETRVGRDDLRALLLGLHNPPANQGVLLECVGPDNEEDVRIGDVLDRLGHRTGAEGAGEADHGRGVAEAGAVVHVRGLHGHARELLHQVVLFVRDTGRGERHALLSLVLLELLGHQVKRLVPGRLDELAVLLDQRGRQPVLGVDELPGIVALGAELAFVDRAPLPG
jgi:hypothetical protein